MSGEVLFFATMAGIYALGAGLFAGFTIRPKLAKRRATVTAPANSSTKFCRDCRWAFAEPTGLFGRDRNWAFARCLHPTSLQSAGDFLASGQHTPDNAHFCSTIRTYSGPDQCGETAMHWQNRITGRRAHELTTRT